MKTLYNTQAELEARDVSKRECNTVTVYKLSDGRYEIARGYDKQRAGEAVTRFNNGWQEAIPQGND